MGSKLCPSKDRKNRICLHAGFVSGQEQVIVFAMVTTYSFPVYPRMRRVLCALENDEVLRT